jgi:hypothetical protein
MLPHTLQANLHHTAKDLITSYLEAEQAGGVAKAGTAQHAWDRLASDLAFNASTVMVR